MKKFFYRITPIGLFCMTIIMSSKSQAPAPPPPSPKIVSDNEDHSEIIIRQKGDKDTKISLEIKNGEYFINGKPLEKFDDQNIVIEKRDVPDDRDEIYSPSPFRVN